MAAFTTGSHDYDEVLSSSYVVVLVKMPCLCYFEACIAYKVNLFHVGFSFINVYYMCLCYGSVGLLLVNLLHQKYAEFVVIRLDIRKMGSCLWLVMCVVFLFVDPAMSMRGAKGPSAALNATLATGVTKVSLDHFHTFFFLLAIRTLFLLMKNVSYLI